jgi:hypothetical protein
MAKDAAVSGWPSHLRRPPTKCMEDWLWRVISHFPDWSVELSDEQIRLVRAYVAGLPTQGHPNAIDWNKHLAAPSSNAWPQWVEFQSYSGTNAGLRTDWPVPDPHDVRVFLEQVVEFNTKSPRPVAAKQTPTRSSRRIASRQTVKPNAHQRAAVVKAVKKLGPDAAVKNVLTEAGINEQVGRHVLRDMEADGKFHGFQRRKSN